MSDKLMDTAPGGEQTQYESENADVQPTAKQAGQLGDASTHTSEPTHTSKTASSAPNTHGITPADKIRYGQSIQEGGAGGKTNTVSGETSQAGFGGTDAAGEREESAAQARRAQGYGGETDMDRSIGG